MGVQQQQQATPSSPRTSQRRATSPLSSAVTTNNNNGISSKGRRPSTLNVGSSTSSAATTATTTKTSPNSRTTVASATTPPSGKSSPALKRTAGITSKGSPGNVNKASTSPGNINKSSSTSAGNVNKGSSPSPTKPATSTTTPQGPNLATEARSRVRPCGCSRRHGAGHHHASPPPSEPAKEVSRRKSKTQSPRGAKTELEPRFISPAKDGNNRYVSTLEWVPSLQPHKFSTTLVVSSHQPTFTDVIYIKPRYRERLHEERVYCQDQTLHCYTSLSADGHTASSLRITSLPVT